MAFGSNLGVAKVERELRESYGDRVPPNWDRNLSACMYFVAFDIVYFDGPDAGQMIDDALTECGIVDQFANTGEITQLPLAARRKILTKILHPVANRFDMVKSRTVLATDVTERRAAIESFFNEVTVAGEEGLVIKSLSSTYELGEKSRGEHHLFCHCPFH
jgi:ATP-dependent DNA ligase